MISLFSLVAPLLSKHSLTSLPSPTTSLHALFPQPIDGNEWPHKFPAKEHCSKCGLCETSFVANVTDACAFLPSLGMSRIDELEVQVHGRSRKHTDEDVILSPYTAEQDEARFGVLHQPIQLARGVGMKDAQWTGVVTSIAVSMLESGEVDAVACIGAGPGGWSENHPLLARSTDDVLRGRGVKPSLAPSLLVLDEIRSDPSIRRLLFCGVGCSVQAFRSIQEDLQLDEVYVLGTNCVDNSPSPEMAERFVRDGVKIDTAEVLGYEFMQDYRVHVKTASRYVKVPYFSLPGSIAEQSIAKSCLTCFDYTNGLSDVVVGYMGAPLVSRRRMDESQQTLTCRNARGASMVQTAIERGRLKVGEEATGSGSFKSFAVATVLSDAIVQGLLGEHVKENGLPLWLGEVFAELLGVFGPKQLNFARYSIDYHILRNWLYLLAKSGGQVPQLPKHASKIVSSYVSSDEKVKRLLDCIQTRYR